MYNENFLAKNQYMVYPFKSGRRGASFLLKLMSFALKFLDKTNPRIYYNQANLWIFSNLEFSLALVLSFMEDNKNEN